MRLGLTLGALSVASVGMGASVTTAGAVAGEDELPTVSRRASVPADVASGSERNLDRARSVIDPATMKRGPDARIDYLQDGIIHPANGDAIRVPIPHGSDQLALLGRGGGDWLVAWGTDWNVREGQQFGVSRVRAGRKPVPVPRQGASTYEGGEAYGWRLDRNGRMLVRTFWERDWAETTVWKVSDGSRLGRDSDSSFTWPTPLDVADGHVALLTLGTADAGLQVADWAVPHTYTSIAKRAALVDLRRGLAFAKVSKGLYGPLTIASGEDAPAWSAPMEPLAVSPSGRSVLGLRTNAARERGVIEVRNIQDGQLLDAIAVGDQFEVHGGGIGADHERTVQWETDASFVMQTCRTRQGSSRPLPGRRQVRARVQYRRQHQHSLRVLHVVERLEVAGTTSGVDFASLRGLAWADVVTPTHGSGHAQHRGGFSI